MLFPDGIDQMPRLNATVSQAFTLNTLALSIIDQPGRAALLFRRDIAILEKENDQRNTIVVLRNLSNVLRFSGDLRESESVARRALIIERQLDRKFGESVTLYCLGITLAARSDEVGSAKALNRSIILARISNAFESYDFQAMRALWFGEYDEAQTLANNAMAFSQKRHIVWRVIFALQLQGEAALGLGDLPIAEERLHYALVRARAINLVQVEIPALVKLAEIRHLLSDLKSARELLDDVWEPCERGPFRLFHADAFNVLAQIERDTGKQEAAVKAAMEAYRLAWCDGPPFAYHWGLQKAKAHLAALGVSEPVLPPFDESKYEPMPEVEIEPLDEDEDDFEIEP